MGKEKQEVRGMLLEGIDGGLSRNVRIERTYSLGDYKNIKFYDSIYDIPEHLATDDNFMAILSLAQLLHIETAFRRYLKLSEQHPLKLGDEAIEALEEERQRTVRSLAEFLTNGDG